MDKYMAISPKPASKCLPTLMMLLGGSLKSWKPSLSPWGSSQV